MSGAQTSFIGNTVGITFRFPELDTRTSVFRRRVNEGEQPEIEGDTNGQNDINGLSINISSNRIELIATERATWTDHPFNGIVITDLGNSLAPFAELRIVSSTIGHDPERLSITDNGNTIQIDSAGLDHALGATTVIEVVFDTGPDPAPDPDPTPDPDPGPDPGPDPDPQPVLLTPEEAQRIAYLYETGLSRFPDVEGLNFWIDEREGSLTEVEIAEFFLVSPEFQQNFGNVDSYSDREFVQLLYRNVLGRDGELAGVDFWTGTLAAPGYGRAALLVDFATSSENRGLAPEITRLAETDPGNWAFTPDPQRDEFLQGTDGPDVINGIGGDDEIVGAAGNDRIDGGEGNDLLDGGAGDDLMIGGTGNDTLQGGAGIDMAAYLFDSSAYTMSAPVNGVVTVDGPEGRDVLSGVEQIQFADQTMVIDAAPGPVDGATEGPDTLIGDADPNVFFGLGGNDTLIGLGADDLLEGDGGNDVIEGGDGSDFLGGGEGIDALDGGAGDDTLWGDGGNDIIEGGPGRDTAFYLTSSFDYVVTGVGLGQFITVSGPEGIDVLTGVEVLDFLDGQIFTLVETYSGTAFADTISADDGDNTVLGFGGNDELLGLGGNDVLDGGDGIDFLVGGAGDDSLIGGAGNDILSGEDGNDTLIGTEGSEFDDFFGGPGDDLMIGSSSPFDIAFFAFNASSYFATQGFDGSITLSGPEGTDVLIGIEQLFFLDQTVFVSDLFPAF